MNGSVRSYKRYLDMMANFSLEDRVTSLQRQFKRREQSPADLSVTNLYLRVIGVQENVFQKLIRLISRKFRR